MKTITIAPHTPTLFDFDRELIASLPASGPRRRGGHEARPAAKA